MSFIHVDFPKDRGSLGLRAVNTFQGLSPYKGFVVVVCCNDAVRYFAFHSQVHKTSFYLIPVGLQRHGAVYCDFRLKVFIQMGI